MYQHYGGQGRGLQVCSVWDRRAVVSVGRTAAAASEMCLLCVTVNSGGDFGI